VRKCREESQNTARLVEKYKLLKSDLVAQI
jgi:hypothetical protein